MQALLRCAKTVRMPHNNEPTVVRVGMHTGGCGRVCVRVCVHVCILVCVSMCVVYLRLNFLLYNGRGGVNRGSLERPLHVNC